MTWKILVNRKDGLKEKEMISRRNSCRGCFSKKIFCFLDFGRVPLAGGFLSPEEIKKEKKFPLKIYYCKNCGLVQILDVVNPKILFNKYFYQSSVIRSLAGHFKEYSIFLKNRYLSKKNSKLLEFGCNDGVLLQYLRDIDAYGVEPSKNISQLAKGRGFKIFQTYFNRKTAQKIKAQIGEVDVVSGSNVFAHIDDIHEVMKAAKILMKPEGVFIIEVHYLKDLIDKFQYDTIYHEHLCYYSVKALKKIMSLEDLKIIDIRHLAMHGGAIRVVIAKKDSGLKESQSVNRFVRNEAEINLKKLKSLKTAYQKHRKGLVLLLRDLKNKKKQIAGYGAAGRGAMLLNFCGIGPKTVDYIVDVSPLRQGKLMPGTHIPIYGVEIARKNPPDYFLILAWNYASSIIKQEKKISQAGTKFIIPLPKISIR